ncbi:Clp protease N-terminal domain-containing protein [Leifsonia poae]|uniref:Clp protease N-terminal domain-containing protein n=1 Tax=Leifsonia poae TaxID=110933 RepID=UPI001CBDCC5E|nr:Clp protease N-terminal domain-containing protein [Leifsonia poae]
MVERRDRDDHGMSRALREIIIRAVAEAQHRGDSVVEAEHLLLSLSRETGSPAAGALDAAGLDHAGIEAALRAERAASLASAGVAPIDEERLAAMPRIGRPRWGTSARDVLARAHRESARTRNRAAETDLLAAILGLDLGTVPRAIALAGVDREAVLAHAGAESAPGSPGARRR